MHAQICNNEHMLQDPPGPGDGVGRAAQPHGAVPGVLCTHEFSTQGDVLYRYYTYTVQILIYTCIYIYIYTHTHIHIYICIHIDTHIDTYIHKYIYIYVYVCIYIYIYIYIKSICGVRSVLMYMAPYIYMPGVCPPLASLAVSPQCLAEPWCM